ncbi:MAG TPA: pyridoxal-phosphate dependent enzyme [Thermoanaerobaculia bacterium]|nr:pyridoxal-phosphate dependent enzyme [Thermoanaerobaculia bacterium]
MPTTNDLQLPTLADVSAAHSRISAFIHRTPLIANASIDARLGGRVLLKCENLQRAGAFKIRGALNAMSQLKDEERRRGVVAFSSGNHAQGVALAGKLLGVRTTLVIPEGANQWKVDATRGYGAEVVQAGVGEATRGEVAQRIAAETGASIIPPFDDSRVIAGAGTVGLEIHQDLADAENVFVPLGGGGLLAGTALALTSLNPRIRVYGVEPLAGNDGQRSFRSGEIVRIDPPRTIADGARTTALGVRNFAIIRERVTDILAVDDDELLEVLKFVMYRTKLVIEPTGALAIAALLTGKVKVNGVSVAVISGGNIDFSLLGRN